MGLAARVAYQSILSLSSSPNSVMSAIPNAHIYLNVMEPLVTEEVQRQLHHLPAKVSSYINAVEVIAYALNRLPPLYATSEQGWQQQQRKAKQTMSSQITQAVRQAIAAVQQDPLRSTKPLLPQDQQDARLALTGLRELLCTSDLSWKNLVDQVERALVSAKQGDITWQQREHRSREGTAWRDSRYGL